MTVSVTLSTIPGRRSIEDYGTSKTTTPLGESLGTETLPAVTNVAGIRAAVARFGNKVRAEHPEASFYISVRLAKGNRKPNGFDVASRGNGLGQEDFMHVTDRRTKLAVPAAAAGTIPDQPAA